MRVYLDYAATTPVSPLVVKAMNPYQKIFFGNPMAPHFFGEETRKAIELAREQIADFFNFDHEEIVFTSGATESNNLAVKGIIGKIGKVESGGKRGKSGEKIKQKKYFLPHIITTAYEHHCVLDSVKYLVKTNQAEATFVKPDKNGVINPTEIQQAIKPNTVLISVMYVNNEIGTINPLKKIGVVIKKEKIRRKEIAGMKKEEALPLYFHSDVVQAVNYLPCNMIKLGVDLFSFSAHKIYGPKGVGVLGIKKNVLMDKIQHGGGQEFGLRAGTHNVPGIVGAGEAIRIIKKKKISAEMSDQASLRAQPNQKITDLRDYFWEKLQRTVKDIQLNGCLEKRIANNLNVSFAGVEGESATLALSMEGIACSTGSACSSGSLESSHVLLAIGLSHPQAHGSLRFTLGTGTTKAEIDYATLRIKEVIEKLRKISGYKK